MTRRCSVCGHHPCRCEERTALWHLFWVVAILGILHSAGCAPPETPARPGDNLRCRCVGLDEYFIRGPLRSSISLGGGRVRVTGENLECELDCEVDPIQATE